MKDLYSETIQCWWKKLKMIQTDGKINCALGLEEFNIIKFIINKIIEFILVLVKWPQYPRQSTDFPKTHRKKKNTAKTLCDKS